MDTNPENNTPQDFSDDEIKTILKEALLLKLGDKRKIPRRNELNNALISTIGEFLNCFKLIGFDLEGNPVNMTVYKQKMEKSALDNAFMEEINKFISNRMM